MATEIVRWDDEGRRERVVFVWRMSLESVEFIEEALRAHYGDRDGLSVDFHKMYLERDEYESKRDAVDDNRPGLALHIDV